MTRSVVIGVGNPNRSDDAIGLELVKAMPDLSGIDVKESYGEASALMELWQGYDVVYLIDAIQFVSEIGKIHTFDVSEKPLPEKSLVCSTHIFGVQQAIELARAMKKLPDKFIVIGIEGKKFTMSNEMSPELKRDFRKIANKVSAVILRYKD